MAQYLLSDTYIEPKYIQKVSLIKDELQFFEYINFFSQCSKPKVNKEKSISFKISQHVLINNKLIEELKIKYKTEYYQILGGIEILIVESIVFEPIKYGLWQFPEEIFDLELKKITENVSLYSVYFYQGVQL